VFVIVWWLCLLLWGLCLSLCDGCVYYCGGFVFYCLGVVFDIVWGLGLLFVSCCVCHYEISLVFGCSKLIMHFTIRLLRFGAGTSSGVVCANLILVHLDKGVLDLSVSHFIYPLFWCVSIVFEVH